MLVLVVPRLQVNVDFLKILKMAIIHDLVEIEAEDISILEYIDNKKVSDAKQIEEEKAIKNIRTMLGESGKEIYDLWFEFEEQKTIESKVLKALDKLEGQLQFLSESVATFTDKDQKAIAKIFEESSELSKIDPFIVELDELTIKDRQNRIKH
jgi:putative hydrolase of HD superfamily